MLTEKNLTSWRHSPLRPSRRIVYRVAPTFFNRFYTEISVMFQLHITSFFASLLGAIPFNQFKPHVLVSSDE